MSKSSMHSSAGWSRSFPYQVEYKDHFESPVVAYKDIVPFIDWVASPETDTRSQNIMYDPYYCAGRTKEILQSLGFSSVVHERRDFYEDIAHGRVPVHDTLVTNPPYSDHHKKKCLDFCLKQLREFGRPFFILMPNYVAARAYYRNRVENGGEEDVVYFIPSRPYKYDHPEGTGKEISPFASIWYCGIGKDRIRNLKKESFSCQGKIAKTVEELRVLKVIPTQKRPNPRQRKKRKVRDTDFIHQTATNKTCKNETSSKKSRYRDEKGFRTRKRF